MPATSALDIVRANHSRRREIQGELRQIDEAATTEKRDYTDDEKATIEARRSELGQIDDRIAANVDAEIRSRAIDDGIESMLGAVLDRTTGELHDRRSVGGALTDAAEYRAWADQGGQNGHLRVQINGEFRAITEGTLASGSAGTLVRPDRLPGVVMETIDRPVALLDLVPHIQTTQNSVEYVQDVTPQADLVDAVGLVPELGAKPNSGLTFQLVTEPIKTVAVMQDMTRQTMADVPQFMGYVDGRMRYALRRKADAQLIGGTGTGTEMTGILNRSGINTYAPGSSEARYKSIRHGITMMEQDETVPEIVLLNPADAEIFDLSNETTAGLHAIDTHGGLAMAGPRTAWGLRQVRTNAVASGTAVLVDPTAVAVFDRQQITAYSTDSHGENFGFNVITLLLEARLGVGVFQPAGICKITFNGSV